MEDYLRKSLLPSEWYVRILTLHAERIPYIQTTDLRGSVSVDGLMMFSTNIMARGILLYRKEVNNNASN